MIVALFAKMHPAVSTALRKVEPAYRVSHIPNDENDPNNDFKSYVPLQFRVRSYTH
jgi:hypothetical protein